MNEPQDELLGDLESIRTLLEEEQELTDLDAELEELEKVPLLQDRLDDVLELEETPLAPAATGLTSTPEPQPSGRLEPLDALLGDEWKAAASELLTTARGAIEAHRNRWTPEDTDELNAALQVRIDSTLTGWLEQTLRDHIDELRAELLEAAQAVISERIDTLLEREYPPVASDLDE